MGLFDNEELDALFEDSYTEAEAQVADEPQEKLHYDEVDEEDFYKDLEALDFTSEEMDDMDFFFPEGAKEVKAKQGYAQIPEGKLNLNGTAVERGRDVYKRLVKQGYNPNVLGAILGNGVVESNLNPYVKPGDSGTAFGINQNRFEKQDQFSREFNSLKLEDSLDKHVIAQYNSVKKNYGNIYNTVAKAGNVKDAAHLYGKLYEKPKYLKNDRSIYADAITHQTGGLTYAQAGKFNAPGNPYLQDDYFSKQKTLDIPYYNLGENLKNNIGYSPVQQGEIKLAPEDLSKTIANSSNIMNSTKARADVKPTEVPVVDPVTAVISAVDKQGAALFNGINTLYNGFKDGRELIAKTADAGLSAAQAVFGERANQREYNKQLKNLYLESERNYYNS